MDIAEINEEISLLHTRLEYYKEVTCEVYSRIVGYYRAIKNWNKGKREEYDWRTPYDVNSARFKVPELKDE